MKRKKLLAGLICLALTVTDILSGGMRVSASELGEAADAPIQTQTAETETADAESEPEKTEEDAAAEDMSTASALEKQEAESDENALKENETDSATEEEGPENADDSAMTEVADAESEIAETESTVEDSIEDFVENSADAESETEVSTAEKVLRASATDIASGAYTENGSNVTWVIDENGKLTVEGTGEFAKHDIYIGDTPWKSYTDSIKSAEIKVTGMANASSMFYGCTNLTGVDLSGFDTSKVTNMRYMFYGCENLASVDVSGFDTAKVTDMGCMFQGCEKLSSVDVSGFNTSNVKNMGYMFSGCKSLTSVDVSGFDTGNVGERIYYANGVVSTGSMDSMFYDCKSLTDVDVSHFDTRKAGSISRMFGNCSSLTSLNLSNFDTTEIRDMNRIVSGCSSLVSVDISGFKSGEDVMVRMDRMFEDCSSLVSVNLTNVDTSNATSMARMFYNCKNLTSLDVSHFDTSNVSSMSLMFGNCSSLTSLDVSNFSAKNTTDSKVDLSSMFYGCSGLTTLDIRNFGTGSATDMCMMFSNCSGLTSLDVSNFDTSNVTDMSGMFEGCSSLTTLNLSNFNTGNVINMGSMFYDCSSLTDLDISNFDTSNVTMMGRTPSSYSGGMFQNCSSLTSLNLSSFNTSNVTSMFSMFWGCKSLTTLDLSNFDTSNVTDMNFIFDGCSSLTSLDLSSFDTSNVGTSYDYNMYTMFNSCENLGIIYTPHKLAQSVHVPQPLESDIWYDCEGTQYIMMPQNLGYSIALMKNQRPFASAITATKTKTAYECGDTLNIDDLTVYYYNDKGKPVKVTEGYTTNADAVDMSTIGKKTLRITYNDMTADVDITVGNIYTVTFTGTGKDDIAEGTAGWLTAGGDYTFTLQKKEGSIYTVSAMMGEETVTLNPDAAGTTFTISGVNNNLVITIEKTAESGLSIRFVNENDKKTAYTGTAIQPQISVTYNGKKLISGTDYTVKYANNIKVGTAAKITVTGKGNFAGGNSATTFEIVPRSIADATLCSVTADADGKEILTLANGSKLDPILYYNNIKLTNKDYVIKDAGGTELAGRKLSDSDNNTTITIEGKSGGNFTGSREVKLNVVDKKKLIKFAVTVNKDKLNTLTYDGNPHCIHEISGAITVTAKDASKTTMEYGRDYTIVYPSDVTNAGTKKFTVVGRGLYTGNVSKSYTIKPAKDAALSVKYDGSIVTGNKITTPFPFTSSGITFGSKLTVTDGNGNALSEGTDYKVSYNGNKKVGTAAKCTITFLGNYKGYAKQTVGFEIAKADLKDAEVIIADKAYMGKAGIYKSVPYVIEDKNDTNVLLKSSNYKITYYTEDPTNNDNAAQMKGKNTVGAGGTVWVKLEAKGNNYSGSQIVSYKVREVSHNLSKAKITFQDTDGNIVTKMPYTGNKITDQHIKAVVDGVPAEKIDGIEVIYVNNINKGKATVIIKGTDTDACAYADCKTAAFSIVARSFSLN